VPTRRLGALSAVLLAVGVVLMVVPPLVRDGICGILGCADQIPDIAVPRTAEGFAVLVPEEAAPAVRSVRLLQGGASGSRQWAIRREAGPDADTPDAFVAGTDVAGFRTTTPLASQPDQGEWIAEVGFRCTTASLPFLPEAVGVGQVVSWSGATEGASFSDSARVDERCTEPAGTSEKVLLVLGAVLTVLGAVLGIVWVFRRPSRLPPGEDDDPWAEPSETGRQTSK
jgi:hypothetical protein